MSESLVDNRLTIVPAIGVYRASEDSTRIRGRVGVTASNITCAPRAGEAEQPLGEWSASDSKLYAMRGPGDRGPRSGLVSDYEEMCLANGRHRMLVTDSALLGAVEGRTGWGASGKKKVGQLLVWKWSLADIHEIEVYRIKKYFKIWDVQLTLRCTDPVARLEYSGLGEAAAPFRAVDKTAKAASVDGSEALGLAETLAKAVTASFGGEVTRRTREDGKDRLFTYQFPRRA